MKIQTTRFGRIEIEPEDVLLFPHGLMAFESCRDWVLLSDPQNDAVAWLQSVDRPEVAMAVVSPRRFVPDYQVHVSRNQLRPLQLDGMEETYVLAIVGRNERSLTLNLKAPLIINLHGLLGQQVIVHNDQPLQYEFACEPLPLRKSA